MQQSPIGLVGSRMAQRVQMQCALATWQEECLLP